MSRSRGFSLIEVIVALALMGVLAAICFEAFFAGGKKAAKVYDRMQLEERSDLMWQKLLRDLGKSSAEGFSRLAGGPTAPEVISLDPLRGVTDQCTTVWGPSLVIYWREPSDNTLRRREWDTARGPALSVTPNPALPTRLSDSDLLTLAQTPYAETRKICYDVEIFQFDYPQSPGPLQMPLQVRIKLAMRGQFSDRRYTYAFTNLSP